MRRRASTSIILVGCLILGCKVTSTKSNPESEGNDAAGAAGRPTEAGASGSSTGGKSSREPTEEAGAAGDPQDAEGGVSGSERPTGSDAGSGTEEGGSGSDPAAGGAAPGAGGGAAAGAAAQEGGSGNMGGDGNGGDGSAGTDGATEPEGATIASTTAGGPWHDAATWADGVVPGPDDNAIIRGEVHVDLSSTGEKATCRNLTLAKGTVLRAEPYGQRTVIVHGDLENEGTVRNGPEGASYDDATLTVELGGNLLQKGAYGVSSTTFIGSKQQSIGLGTDVVLSGAFVDDDPESPLVASTPLSVNGAAFTLATTDAATGALDLGEYALKLAGGNFKVVGGELRTASIVGVAGATLTVDRIASTGDCLELEGDVCLGAATVPAATDDSAAGGLVEIDGSVCVMPEAAFYNQSYAEPVVFIGGDLTNEGTLRYGPGYAAYGEGSFTMRLQGDLVQKGTYSATATHFVGGAAQSISVGTEQFLAGSFVDDDPASALTAASAITAHAANFSLGSADGAQGTLDMTTHALTLAEGNVRLENGTLRASHLTGVLGGTLTTDRIVVAGDSLDLQGDISVSAATVDPDKAPEPDLVNVLAIAGSVHVMSGAVLYNQSYTDPIVTITGDLENDGVVRAGPGYAAYGSNTLTVSLAGDLTVNGAYSPTSTNFIGATEQKLSLGAEQTLSGAFTDETPASALVAASALVLGDATINLGSADDGGTLDMDGFALSHPSGTLQIPFGALAVDDVTGAAEDPATMDSVFVVPQFTPPSGTLTLHGYCATATTTITGNLVVDTGSVLYNKYQTAVVVTVTGTVTENGIIGSGRGYASYDDGTVTLNGVLRSGWTAGG
jgi:hypothetical protein